jgi:tRNA 2-selenouridine synthase
MKSICIEDFLTERERTPIVDVRSPSEFNKGHIQGAFNIPLFSDEERAIVGTKYVQESRYSSVMAGLDMVGPKLSGFVETASKIAPNGKVLVYCWRGGMRSSSMSWLLNLAGINSKTLIGGYKSYRRYSKEYLSKPFKLIVLGGMTGSGKTELIHELSKHNQQIIDLEGLANHKGSAFGSIGQKPQPSTEFFENLLFENLYRLDIDKPIWVEDESKTIGSVFIPQEFFNQMLNSTVIAIERSTETRIKRLTSEYTNCNPQLLIDSVNKIAKRLGGDNVIKAIKSIEEGKFEEAVGISLYYYDKAYQFGLSNKINSPIICPLDDENISQNCSLLIETLNNVNST